MIKNMRARLNEKKGFTLAELLIVVAIIAVLVAIAIPIFNTQLERAREATDAANLRAAYAEVVAAALTAPDTDHSATVTTRQATAGWLEAPEVAGATMTDAEAPANGTVDVTYDHSTGAVAIGSVTVDSSFMN